MGNNFTIEDKSEFLNIKEVLYLLIRKWYWILASVVLSLSCAVFYLLLTPPVYERTSDLLIKEDSKTGSLSANLEQSFGAGLFNSNINVNNEILSIKSPDNIYQAVKRMNFNVHYSEDGIFHDKVVYGNNLPLKVSFLSDTEDFVCSFVLKTAGKGKFSISEIMKNGEKLHEGSEITGELSKIVSTPLGSIMVEPAAFYDENKEIKLNVFKNTLLSETRNCKKTFSVELKEEKSSVVSLSFKDRSVTRAEDFLKTIIQVYNENWVEDKNKIAFNTSKFINERLIVIEKELGSVDENISSFKSTHLIPDLQAASGMYMAQSSEKKEQIFALNNQLYMSEYILDYLKDGKNDKKLLPVNSGISNINIESQIQEYNNMVLKRDNLVANSSESNPLVVTMDMSMASVKNAIIGSVENHIKILDEQIKALQTSEKQTISKIADNPGQAKYLISVERQQKVKEALYLFLLQKREENELSQTFTAYNTRVITSPGGSDFPCSPIKKNILLIAIVIGLFVPSLIIFLLENFNTKVRGKKDLDKLSVPFIGEIPLIEEQKSRFFRKKQKRTVKEILVKSGLRDVVNEAFRVLRTNIEFMTNRGQNSNVFIMTSFNPGSGKSFLAMNLAMSLAIKNKKVLVIDGDMRHASSSAYISSPKRGLSDYLAGNTDSIKDILYAYENSKYYDVIPVGKLPPNPAELLFGQRLENLIKWAKENYDYVFVDCPPIEIVADTQIIGQYADRTIFVLRAGVVERDMLGELQKLYDENKFKNISLVLNGIKNEGGRYGYKYGYGGGGSYYGNELV